MNTNKVVAGILAASVFLSFTGIQAIEAKWKSDDANKILNSMSVEEKVGQILMPEIRTWNGESVNKVNGDVKEVIQKYKLGGILLNEENLSGDIGQVTKLTSDLQNASPDVPLLISVEQDGGASKIKSTTPMLSNMALAATGDVKETSKAADIMSKELLALGINVNMGPVLDVVVNPTNEALGVKSFGSDPQRVSRHGAEYIDTMQKNNLITTAKHFPGSGNAIVDTSIDLPVITSDYETVQNRDLKPFKSAINAGVDMIMTSHAAVTALDDTKITSTITGKDVNTPATFSSTIINKTLRKKMGFKGVVVSDALNKRAITNYFTPEEAAINALNAGCDMLLVPVSINNADDLNSFDKVYNSIVSAVKNGTIKEDRLNAAAGKVLNLKAKRELAEQESKSLSERQAEAKKVVATSNNKAIERDIASNSTVCVKNEGNMLPLRLNDNSKIVYYEILIPEFEAYEGFKVPYQAIEKGLKNVVNKTGVSGVEIEGIPINVAEDLDIESKKYLDAMDDADYVVISLNGYSYSQPEAQNLIKELIDKCNNEDKKYFYLNNSAPYDTAYLKDAKAIISTYSDFGTSLEAGYQDNISTSGVEMGINAAFGLTTSTGKSPVDVRKIESDEVVFSAGKQIVNDKVRY